MTNLTQTAPLPLTDPKFTTALTGLSDWKQATLAAIRTFIESGQPFSSGEVVSVLRNHDKTLRFAATRCGEYCRDLFYTQQMPQYADDGTGTGPTHPINVGRITAGRFPARTPAGVEVFVYGPNQAACMDHEFEVFIPAPGEVLADAPTPVCLPPATPASQAKQIAILGTKIDGMALCAHVRPDGRLEIPRNAFEACVHLSGKPLKGGDSVYVKVEDHGVTVSQRDPGDGSQPLSLSQSRGRVIVTPPANMGFMIGRSYLIDVEPGELFIPLV